MDLSCSNIKKFLIFSQKKAFLIFPETETPKKIIIFQEKELSYISANGNPKKPHSSKNKKNPTLKKFLIFREMELYSPVVLNIHFSYYKSSLPLVLNTHVSELQNYLNKLKKSSLVLNTHFSYSQFFKHTIFVL